VDGAAIRWAPAGHDQVVETWPDLCRQPARAPVGVERFGATEHGRVARRAARERGFEGKARVDDQRHSGGLGRLAQIELEKGARTRERWRAAEQAGLRAAARARGDRAADAARLDPNGVPLGRARQAARLRDAAAVRTANADPAGVVQLAAGRRRERQTLAGAALRGSTRIAFEAALAIASGARATGPAGHVTADLSTRPRQRSALRVGAGNTSLGARRGRVTRSRAEVASAQAPGERAEEERMCRR
jgi:hypothetical protein